VVDVVLPQRRVVQTLGRFVGIGVGHVCSF